MPPGLSPAPWRTSSYSSQDGNCVEVTSDRTSRNVMVRDTKDRGGFTLHVPAAEWRRFVSAARQFKD